MPPPIEDILSNGGMLKRIIEKGEGAMPEFQPGTLALVEFCTRRANGTVAHSSYTMQCNEGVEVRFGKSFCVPAWETAVRTMRVGERARFHCQPTYTRGYAQLIMVLDQHKTTAHAHHDSDANSHPSCCAAGAASQSDLFKELSSLQNEPLDFELFLKRVEQSSESMDDLNEEQLLERALALRQSGKDKFAEKQYEKALTDFREAVKLGEKLGQFERKGTATPKVRDGILVPCLCNMGACLLVLAVDADDDASADAMLGECVAVCSRALGLQCDCVKALVRRVRANVRRTRARCDVEQAQRDLDALGRLAPSLDVQPERSALDAIVQWSLSREKSLFAKMF